jgi:hypothetical protein
MEKTMLAPNISETSRTIAGARASEIREKYAPNKIPIQRAL